MTVPTVQPTSSHGIKVLCSDLGIHLAIKAINEGKSIPCTKPNTTLETMNRLKSSLAMVGVKKLINPDTNIEHPIKYLAPYISDSLPPNICGQT